MLIALQPQPDMTSNTPSVPFQGVWVLKHLELCKLRKHRLDKSPVRWMQNCLDPQTRQIALNASMCSWEGVSSRVPQGSAQDLVLFNIFMNDLGEGI